MTPLLTSILGLLFSAALVASPAENQDELIVYLGSDGGTWQLRACLPGGGLDRQLTDDATDKTRISFAESRPSEVLVCDQRGEVFFIDLVSGKRSPIMEGIEGVTDAVINPDGSSVAYSISTLSSIDNNDIFLYDIATSQRRVLVSWPGVQNVPAFDRKGRYLYFANGDGGDNNDIYRLDLLRENTTPEAVTSGALYNFDVSVSHAGRVAYTSNRTGDYEVFLANGDGASPRRLTFHRGLDGSPTFSPDGRSLAWISSDGVDQRVIGRRVDTWVDREPRRLTPQGLLARSPLWIRQPEASPWKTPALQVRGVSTDRTFFDPKEHESVVILAQVTDGATATCEIVTLDGETVTELAAPKRRNDGAIQFRWDGRVDGKIADPAPYVYRITATRGQESVVYDLSEKTGAPDFVPTDLRWDKENGCFRYVLSKPACVRLHLGLGSQVLLLNNLVDFEARPAGVNEEPWDGMDISGVFKFDEHPDMHVWGRAYTLPTNSVVIEGKRLRPSPPNWTDVTTIHVPVGRRMYQHGQMKLSETFDIPAVVTYLPPTKDEPLAGIRVDTLPEYRTYLMSERLEVCYWLDGKMHFEDEAGFLPYTYRFDPNILPGESHIFSVNIIGYDGHFGIASLAVPGRAAKTFEGSPSSPGGAR